MGAISEECLQVIHGIGFLLYDKLDVKVANGAVFSANAFVKGNAICAIRITKVVFSCETVLRLLKYFF